MRAHDLPHGMLNLVHGRTAIDDSDAVGLGGGKRVISVVDLAVEVHRLVIQASFGMGFGGVAGAGTGEAGLRVDIHQDGEIGLEAAAGDAVERTDGADAKAAAYTLIDERRIGE